MNSLQTPRHNSFTSLGAETLRHSPHRQRRKPIESPTWEPQGRCQICPRGKFTYWLNSADPLGGLCRCVSSPGSLREAATGPGQDSLHVVSSSLPGISLRILLDLCSPREDEEDLSESERFDPILAQIALEVIINCACAPNEVFLLKSGHFQSSSVQSQNAITPKKLKRRVAPSSLLVRAWKVIREVNGILVSKLCRL